MTQIQPPTANQFRRPWDETASAAATNRPDAGVDPRDRFEAALAHRARQRLQPVAAESALPEGQRSIPLDHVQSSESTESTPTQSPLNDGEVGRSWRSTDDESEPAETNPNPNLQCPTSMRPMWRFEETAKNVASEAVDNKPVQWVPSDVAPLSAPEHVHQTTRALPERLVTTERLHAAALTPSGENAWRFEIAGDRSPVSSVLIQHGTGMPLQVGLQSHGHRDARPSATSLQRLQDRLASQGVWSTQWEESDTP